MAVNSMNRVQVENFGRAPIDWDDCAICLDVKDDLLSGHTVKLRTHEVYHKYHESCLNEALARNSSCPECRLPLAARNVRVENPEQALIQLELNFPLIVGAPKLFFKDALKSLNVSLPLAGMLAAGTAINNLATKGMHPFLLGHVLAGGLLGFGISHLARKIISEPPVAHQYENDLERMKHIVASKSFLVTMISSASLGLIFSTGSYLFSSAPIIIGGIATHYAVEKLAENELISAETKTQLQTVTAVATTALSLISPITTIASMCLGAFLGATTEAHTAKNPEGS